MGTCKQCGGSGLFLPVNKDGLCSDCAAGYADRHAPLVVQCQGDVLLGVRGGSVIVKSKRDEISIPISNIQDITLAPPKNLFHGSIKIATAKPPSGFMALGLGISLALDSSILFELIGNSEYPFAKDIRNYVINYVSKEDTSSASVSNLRDLKTLLDDGIITQEEFDAKKKQILGL